MTRPYKAASSLFFCNGKLLVRHWEGVGLPKCSLKSMETPADMRRGCQKGLDMLLANPTVVLSVAINKFVCFYYIYRLFLQCLLLPFV